MALDSLFLAELKARNNIVDAIAPYVHLKRNGTRHTGLCPFHGEKTPSFTVFEDTTSYYCFGCGAGGDVITFTMKYHNLDYMEAVRLLAQQAGMELPERESRAANHQRQRRERMYEMHKLAARFFYDTLMSPRGKEGLDYLLGRGISREMIVKFGLGFAPDSFGALKDHLRSKGFSPDEMLSAGLLAKSQKNPNSTYDKFRNRVMFPVFDLRGNVIAFSGRILGDGQPKYLNSPETDIYTKGNCVFGLQLAKDQPEGLLILCEGNLDVISLVQAGFTGAVAPLGTAFTKEQARILAKYAKSVVVAFDNDSAGLKATEKAISFLAENGIPVRILQMQGAKDPDEFIKKYGQDRFAQLLTSSMTPTEFRLYQLRAGKDLGDTATRVDYIRRAVREIAGLSSAMERDIYILKLCDELKVTAEAVRAEVEKSVKQQRASAQRKELRQEEQDLRGTYDRINPERAANLKAAKNEELLIALLTRHPNLWRYAKEKLPPERMITPFNQRVYRFLLDEYEAAPDLTVPVYAKEFSEAELAKIMFYVNTAVLHGDPKEQCDTCVQAILKEGSKQINTGDLSPEELMKRLQQQ